MRTQRVLVLSVVFFVLVLTGCAGKSDINVRYHKINQASNSIEFLESAYQHELPARFLRRVHADYGGTETSSKETLRSEMREVFSKYGAIDLKFYSLELLENPGADKSRLNPEILRVRTIWKLDWKCVNERMGCEKTDNQADQEEAESPATISRQGEMVLEFKKDGNDYLLFNQQPKLFGNMTPGSRTYQ